ncbi:superinfection exclusion B family protein [Porphyromonas macacae]|uniref:superinfection exclusion B family protein n=1 Tax=Porphyromonas macacae TaxID=28115 RepID=UPI0024AE2BEA|nr:superinfection exclusion B family protein [Porphyromonas macacae]
MDNFLQKLFDIKKIPTQLILVVWLSSFLILSFSESLITKLNLQEFLRDYGKYIGISFILSSAFLLVVLFSYITRSISKKISRTKIKKKVLENIGSLDFREKAVLREFYINNRYTLELPFTDDAVVSLLNKGIIYQASATGTFDSYGAYFPYTITELARNNLTPMMLDFPQRNTTEKDKIRKAEARPAWAKNKD